MGEKLTGADYFDRPLLELSSHPDFDPVAYLVVAKITKMSTEELKALQIMEEPMFQIPNGRLL